MKILFDPPTSSHEVEMEQIVAEVLQTHPIRGEVLAEEDLEALQVKLVLLNDDLERDPDIDCTKFPDVVVNFGRNCYITDEGTSNKDLFRAHMYHEFTHLIDRRNPSFGFTEEKKASLNEVLLASVNNVWNAYIDGRLWRRNIEIQSFERFKEKKFANHIRHGLSCIKKIELCKKAWDSEMLTYDQIISLAKDIHECGWD